MDASDPTKAVDDQHKIWLDEVLPNHERLMPIVQSLLESMVQKEKIEYLSVTGRVKNRDEALRKITSKQYREPHLQLTDLSGIRVVTFLEAQVIAISDVVRQLFEVDKGNSLDRTKTLGLDRLGYRSTHFVCTLGKRRAPLPEYAALGELKFEIQVRTVLQHAWAELAHDSSFKFTVALPSKIERKLNLYSGMLEIVDAGFDEISKEIDNYRASLEHKTINQISDAEIDSISLQRFIEESSIALGLPLESANADVLSDELRLFGVKTIGGLQQLLTPEFEQAYKAQIDDGYGVGFVRLLLMYNNIDRYFELASPPWGEMPVKPYKFLVSKFGEDKVQKLLKQHEKSIEGNLERSGQD
ncbi:RelA/SpoT domain-containing protein [Bradyrhizobium sp. 21]|uniref:GTP pyrophosphokinase n=1 Tax=Bradyrhizobium sp. 21 TaxID=2782666 RepID=UPI001FF7716E|nr:RelA/SpoT domain-containing protein [Bradyrhizobium sp. 21]MCK1386411.1 RelA/SpoT domain-containing protein [Bradyrhizobium sp. 21]